MDPESFRAQLRQKKLLPAYLFTGDQDLLKRQALEELRRAAGGERGAVRTFLGGETSAREIVESRQNLSLLDPVAAIVVRQASRLAKSDCDALLEALPGPSGAPPIVFWDDAVDKRAKLFSEVARRGEVEFKAPSRRELPDWIRRTAREVGKHEVGRGAAETLADLVGDDLLALRSTLERLSIAVGEGRPIDEHTIADHVAASRLHAVYELQDALAEKNAAKAVGLLRRSIDEGQEVPAVVGALAAQARRLLLTREAARGADIARLTGVPSWKADKLVSAARRFSPSRLRRAIRELADIDVASKSGGGEPVAALEDWLLSLCLESPADVRGR